MARRKLTEEEKVEKFAKEEEARKVVDLSNQLQKIRKGYYSDPNRLFKLGDRVDCGHGDEYLVEEVLDGGKIYLIKGTHSKKENHWDKESTTVVSLFYRPWVEVLPYHDGDFRSDSRISFTQKEDVRLNFFQSQVESLLHSYYGSYAGIDLNPDYQRGNVWGLEDKVSLIDSVFNLVDIGKFVLIKLPYEEGGKGFEVLDGKQRLTALLEFYEDRFQYKGKFFRELSWKDRHHFLGFGISRAETRSEEITQEQKYKYFLKLNTSGKPQDPSHLQKVKELLTHEQEKVSY